MVNVEITGVSCADTVVGGSPAPRIGATRAFPPVLPGQHDLPYVAFAEVPPVVEEIAVVALFDLGRDLEPFEQGGNRRLTRAPPAVAVPAASSRSDSPWPAFMPSCGFFSAFLPPDVRCGRSSPLPPPSPPAQPEARAGPEPARDRRRSAARFDPSVCIRDEPILDSRYRSGSDRQRRLKFEATAAIHWERCPMKVRDSDPHRSI